MLCNGDFFLKNDILCDIFVLYNFTKKAYLLLAGGIMNKNIIIAGGGHGGIVAGALLAKNGFNVTVYEKNNRENMGYDWTDIFAPNALSVAGIPMPDKSLYEYKTDMTFYSTNEKKAIRQRVPEDELEIKMERRDIYNHIISFAENAV